MRAIILAAGQGTRLKPLTDDTPKCLVEIEGASLLERQVRVMQSCGVRDIIVVTGYRHKKVESLERTLGIRTCYNPAYRTCNMVESLFRAEKYLSGKLIISYGDILYEPAILKKLLKSRHDISVAADLKWRKLWRMRFSNPLSDAESFVFDSRNRIREIGQKTNDYKRIMAQYIGLMKFSAGGSRMLKTCFHRARKNASEKGMAWGKFPSLKNIFMTDLLQGVIDDGYDVHAVKMKERWLEIDSPEDILLYKKVFRA